jgi:hypothetical protein
MEPELQYLADVRNHLEHRYLKLHVEHWIPPEPGFGAMEDTLAYHLDRTSFEQKTLRLLKLARASLIYLCAAVYLEEGRRDKANPPGDRVFDSELPPMRDEWRF